MRNILFATMLLLISSQLYALKYMCQKAVRGNSGKYNSIKAKLESLQRKGLSSAAKSELSSKIDKAINEIKSANCPMEDPDVTKVTGPLRELKTKIVSAQMGSDQKSPKSLETDKKPSASVPSSQQAAAAVSPKSTNSAPKKLSYPCRQALRRQSGKPKDFERTIVPLREAVKSGKTIGNIQPGFLIDTKIESAISDLNASQCPTDHPDFKVIMDKLLSQKKELPEIYTELKKRLDNLQKRADVSNYPDFEKDLEIFRVIKTRYSHVNRAYKTNVDMNWIEPSSEKKISFQRNIKSPIYKFKKLENLLSSMISDGNAYNSQMKMVEEKYKDLFKANPILAGQYVKLRDNAASILGNFYKEDLENLKKILNVTAEHNTKVLNLWIKESIEKRSPEFFRGDTLKQILTNTEEAISLLALTSKENKEKAKAYQEKMKSIHVRLKEAKTSLAEVMLKEQRLGKERYEGSDKEKIRDKIVKSFKEQYPDKNLIKIQIVNENWKVTDYVTWSSGNAYRTHYSELGFYAVVKETDEVAILVGGWYNVNHKQRDKISVFFTFHGKDDVYQNSKILIKNL